MNDLNDIKTESGKYTCLFSSFGCNFSGNEGELNEHLKQKLKRHLDVVLENMNILKNKNHVLQEELNAIKLNISMFKNKIKEQQKNLKKDIEELKLNMNIISELEEIIKKKDVIIGELKFQLQEQITNKAFTEINDEIITKIKDEVIAVIKQFVFGISKMIKNFKYLCSGSHDKIIYLWDMEMSKLLNSFNKHTNSVRSVEFSPLQSNSNNN
ncbi:hypothetical protein RFI_01922, partial [Reticulomyxa filosa]